MSAKRHRTRKRGIYFIDHDDGTRSFLATWKEERPINIADPLTTRPVVVEREAATFDLACLLKAEGEAAERKRRGEESASFVQRLGERMMAAKYFEYRGRQ